MKFIKLCIISLLTVVISGCIAVDAYNLSKNTIYKPTALDVEVVEHKEHYKRKDDSKASLYVMWPNWVGGPANMASGIYVYLNGARAGAVKHGTYTVLELAPGSYSLAVGDNESNNGDKVVNLAKGQDLYYRTGIDENLVMLDGLYLSHEDDVKYAKKSINTTTYVTMVRKGQ